LQIDTGNFEMGDAMSDIIEIMARADVDYFWQEGGYTPQPRRALSGPGLVGIAGSTWSRPIAARMLANQWCGENQPGLARRAFG
jgi:hypothetical protein